MDPKLKPTNDTFMTLKPLNYKCWTSKTQNLKLIHTLSISKIWILKQNKYELHLLLTNMFNTNVKQSIERLEKKWTKIAWTHQPLMNEQMTKEENQTPWTSHKIEYDLLFLGSQTFNISRYMRVLPLKQSSNSVSKMLCRSGLVLPFT